MQELQRLRVFAVRLRLGDDPVDVLAVVSGGDQVLPVQIIERGFNGVNCRDVPA
jgi:hypothetical protein